MGINILDIKPSVISRDLKGKFVCIYSKPKVGKTSLACKFPKNLLVGFEHGWNAISGAMAVDIQKWSEFKQVVKQLDSAEAKAMYDTISLDTIGLAWKMCEEYICDQQGVDRIGDIPYGAGYSLVEREFEKMIRKITQSGYGLVIIAHVDKHLETDAEDGTEKEIIGPAIPKRAYNVVNQLVDIIGYIDVDAEGQRWLYTRATPTITAGSRFAYMPTRIPLGYNELVNAIADSIDKEAQNGGNVVDKAPLLPVEDTSEKVPFADLIIEVKKYAMALVHADKRPEYDKIVTEYLGKGRNVKDCDESQYDMILLILQDLKEYCENNNIEV